MKSITTDNGNSHRRFHAGLRKIFDEFHKNFEMNFSVLLNKDQEKLVASIKGGTSAKKFDIMTYKKVFVNEASEIIESDRYEDFAMTKMKREP